MAPSTVSEHVRQLSPVIYSGLESETLTHESLSELNLVLLWSTSSSLVPMMESLSPVLQGSSTSKTSLELVSHLAGSERGLMSSSSGWSGLCLAAGTLLLLLVLGLAPLQDLGRTCGRLHTLSLLASPISTRDSCSLPPLMAADQAWILDPWLPSPMDSFMILMQALCHVCHQIHCHRNDCMSWAQYQ